MKLDIHCEKCKGTGTRWAPRVDTRGGLLCNARGQVQRWPQDCARCDGTGRFTPKPKWSTKCVPTK